jgi:hypothetical protein
MGNEVGAFPNDRPVNLPFAPLSAVNKINIRLLTMNAKGKKANSDWRRRLGLHPPPVLSK